VDQHLQIVQALVDRQPSIDGGVSRLGGVQRQIRQRALEFADRLNDAGFALDEAARRLGVQSRTLRNWDQRLRQPAAAIAVLGRPRADSGTEQQQAVLDHLNIAGPGVSVPSLRQQFPSMARAEIDRLVKGYRQHWRAENRRSLCVLHWQVPGTVWAMDFAEAPAPIDGIYPYLLAVRDLASGKQLLWRPVLDQGADALRVELTPLFMAYGAPWVLKCDNGPAFRAEATKWLLQRWGVINLFSPPHTPAYNGSIEAAIGSLKIRTERLANMAGHAGMWTSDLVEAARRQANETIRPRRLHDPAPNEAWDTRPRRTMEQRDAFQRSVEQYREQARARQDLPPGPMDHWTEAAVDREALPRALVAHDLLLFTRRSIPARIEPPKPASKG
jgi:hypothetical protein